MNAELTLPNFRRTLCRMAKKASVAADGSPPVEPKNRKSPALSRTPLRASSLLDTRVIYCGDNLEQLAKLPDACVDLIYIDPPFNSNRNYEVFWGSPCEITPRATTSYRLHRISRGETREKRAFEDRHATCKLIQQIRSHIRLN